MTEPRAVQVGDRISDNDPQMQGSRVLVVTGFKEGRRVVRMGNCDYWEPCEYAVATPSGNGTGQTRIRLDRIHTDGKPRRSGWSLVTP